MLDCPTGSITRQVGSHVVTIDESTCIACGNCVELCPWDNIVMLEPGEHGGNGRPAEVATKCDLSQEPAGTPPCVQACPQGSARRISFKDMPGVSATLGTGDARRLSRLRQVLRPTEPRLLAITAAVALTLTVGQLAYAQYWPWSAKRGVGLALGILAALAFVGEMLYSARRRLLAPGRVRIWLQAHVHLGILGLVAAVLHAGLQWPTGSMGWALLGLSMWTTATGVLGRVLQKWAATSMGTGLRIEAVYQRIPGFVEKLRAEADALMVGASQVLTHFYEVEVRDSLSRVTPSWSYLFDVRAGQQATLAPLRRMVQFVEPEEKERVHDLIAIVTEKMELDAQHSLQGLLRTWPWLHVPAACLLMSVLIVHILAWLWY
jgi:NAD-dependent dihydropyrimidine dehydrogenase PreA subunit